MRRQPSKLRAPDLTNSKEDEMPSTGTAPRMAKQTESETVKMTLYIQKPVVKEFKKLAIDKEMDYSELATIAFAEYVQNHQPDSSSS